MATSYVALLRGINVGKAKRMTMVQLRSVFEGLGHEDVATVGMSGNVAFRSSARSVAALTKAIEGAIRSELSMDVRVLVRPTSKVVAAMDANPMPEEAAADPSRFHLSFVVDGSIDRKDLKPVLDEDWSPEAVAVGRDVVYAWHPNGVTGSKLAEALGKVKGGPVTTSRNWATLTKLVAKAGAEAQ